MLLERIATAWLMTGAPRLPPSFRSKAPAQFASRASQSLSFLRKPLPSLRLLSPRFPVSSFFPLGAAEG